MAFRPNDYQQISINDEFNQLSPRTKKIVEKSWAKDFADIVFPAINEERFAVLYSENKASRSNTPVNFIVGAMMIKVMMGQSDEELLESICCDVRYKYALHTTSYEEQPISDRTLSRFRERLYNHEQNTGEKLLEDEMKALAKIYQDFMNLNSNVKRMDSMMIATSAKRMSRLEILYTVNANAVKLMHRLGADDQIPVGLEHYLSDEDRNDVIYYCKDEGVAARLDKVIEEAEKLRKAMDSDQWLEFSEYQLLLRVLKEQTDTDDEGKRTAKKNKDIESTSLQNPSDPDATFRMKAGKAYKGYVGNFVETVGENSQSLITDFELQPNTYSDSEFSKSVIKKHSATDPKVSMIVDGSYGGTENQKLAEEHNVDLITTALTGKIPDTIFADFEFNEDKTAVTRCPAGHTPEKCSYNEKTGLFRVRMGMDCCKNCPYRDNCKPTEQKRSFIIRTSTKMVQRAQYIKKLSTEEFLLLTRMRNAVEGIPSVLRRRYNIDHSPFRGLIRVGWAYALAIGGYNIKKLLRYRKNTGGCSCYAPNPATA